MKLAIMHEVSELIDQAEVNFREKEPIDFELARRQHDDYAAWLESIGCEVVKLTINSEFPDSVFVEDTAVVVDEVACITPMGVASRRGEVVRMAAVLANYRMIHRIIDHSTPDATLEGGDVLRVGDKFYVGLTTRTNMAGIKGLADILKPLGYSVEPVTVKAGLHLKSAVSALDEETLLVNRPILDMSPFEGYRLIDVPEDEGRGANLLVIGEHRAAYSGYPKTCDLLDKEGFPVTRIDITELIKADSGMTCSSIIMKKL